jgi:hypothetical protein
MGTTENLKPFCIDFKTLQFGELNLPSGISKLYDRINHPNDSTFCVTDGKHVYLIHKENYLILDQKPWTDIESGIDAKYPLIVYESGYMLWVTLILSTAIILIFVIRGLRNKKRTALSQTPQRFNELQFLSKNRIRFKGAIYQLNELDIRHLKLILGNNQFVFNLSDILKEINKQSKHLEISEQNLVDWISRMNAFFTTIGMNQNLIQVQDDKIIRNLNIHVSIESR